MVANTFLTALSIWILSFSAPTTVEARPHSSQPVRVAIIGAGAGGSSAAFWIAKASEKLGAGNSVQVDVFEKSNYIGGRSTVVHPYNDPSLPTSEIGGSLFVSANRNLMRAVKEFNLQFRDFNDDDVTDLGIWDGEQFRLRLASDQGFNSPPVNARYGNTSLPTTEGLVQQMVGSILQLYTPATPVWRTVNNLSAGLGFDPLIHQTGAQYFDSNGVDKKFSREVIEGVTRGNYVQNVDQLHALDSLVSMVAAAGAYSLEGGNFQIFQKFLEQSHASVHLNTQVMAITKSTIGGKTSWVLTTSSGGHIQTSQPYSHVIIAAPIQNAGLVLPPKTAQVFPPVDYVQLHVTHIATTTERPLGARFGNISSVPGSILTTYQGVREGGKKPDFFTLAYGRHIQRGNKLEHTVAFFSDHQLSDQWLAGMFGTGKIGWVFRKVWDAFPVARPTSRFPPVKVDDGLWYPNSGEPFISTMETATVYSRNVVELLFQEQFGQGICGAHPSPNDPSWFNVGADGPIWGWDC